MRLLADENCDRLIVSVLREAGHDVLYVIEADAGVRDVDVIRRAQTDHRIILTGDRDFGLLAEREAAPPAIILMRLDPLDRAARARRLSEALQSIGPTIANEIVVIEPAQVRRRAYGKPQAG
jgi:predicted nuclease of predicted toxin-antitoxin system